MNTLKSVVSIAAASLIVSVAVAGETVDRLTCGEWNIHVGDSKENVTTRCGGAYMEKDGNMYYHRDEDRIVVLHFDGDKVAKMTEDTTSHKGADQ